MAKVKKYDSYEEAQAAVKRLSVLPTNQREYRKLYNQDPRLPAEPGSKYKDAGWSNWGEFLHKKDLYETYEEAQAAMQELTPVPTTYAQYVECRKQDPSLVVNPDKKYKNSGWTSWEAFLGKEKKDLYDTYEEAQAAVQELTPVPSTYTQYLEFRKQDPRLTSIPNKKYKDTGWTSWEVFLGKEKKDLYDTYEEAQAAVQKLTPVPSTYAQYKKSGWTSWEAFLDKEKDLYNTYEEAQAAVQQLTPVPITQREYRERFKQDPMLPVWPPRTYKNKGWVSWYEFLSISNATYEELVDWLKDNGSSDIRTPSDVIKLLKGNASLQATFILTRKRELEGYYDFANLVGIEYQCPLVALKLIKTISPGLSDKSEYNELRRWYRALPTDPLCTYGFETFDAFLSFDKSMLFNKKQAKAYCVKHKIRTKQEYDQIAKTTPQLPLKPSDINGVTRLDQVRYFPRSFSGIFESDESEWVELAEQYCSSGENAQGRKSLLKNFFIHFKDALYSNVRSQFSVNTPLINPTHWFNRLPASQRNESSLNKINAFMAYIIEERFTAVDEETGESVVFEGIRNPLNLKSLPIEFVSMRLHETVKSALPFKFIQKARDFIADANVKNIGGIYQHIKSRTDYFDNYTEWFDVDEYVIDRNDPNCIWREKEGIFQIWSPVKIIATLLQLYKPFRGAQIAWLDSGEGDKYKLTLVDGKPNWVENKLLADYRVPVKQWQGFLKPELFGKRTSPVNCHVNTNKTSKRCGAGYNIPWIDERVLPFIVQLREWQEKYNPITEPIKWSEADLQNESAKSELKKMGYNGLSCFLMRNPTAGDGQSPIKQYTIGTTLRGILHLIEEEGIELTSIKENAPINDYGKASSLAGINTFFTLHSMRVSLITAYIVDAKIAPEVVQKLVGHASIVMTIYYTKVEAETIRAALRDSEELIVKNQTERVEQMIRQRQLDQLESELIDSQGRVKKSQLHQHPVMNIIMDHGICPNAQTKCDDATENGYLGKQNCLSCPHLLTGPAFLGGLQMLVNEISLECKAAAIRIEDHREKIDVLEHEQYEAKKMKKTYSPHKLQIAESTYQQEVTRFDGLTIDMIKAVRLSHQSISLLNSAKSDGSTQLITQYDNGEAQIELNEVSHYLHLDTICQSAEFYQSSRPELANPQRSQLIDIFARKNGLEPGFFALTPKEQIAIGNQVTKLLLARLGSYKRLSQVMDKDSGVTLKDLGISDASTTKTELSFLMSGNINHALDKKETLHPAGVQSD